MAEPKKKQVNIERTRLGTYVTSDGRRVVPFKKPTSREIDWSYVDPETGERFTPPELPYRTAFRGNDIWLPFHKGLEWFGENVLTPAMHNAEYTIMNPLMPQLNLINQALGGKSLPTPVSDFAMLYVMPTTMPSRWVGTLRTGMTPWNPNNPGFGDESLNEMFDVVTAPRFMKDAKTVGSKAYAVAKQAPAAVNTGMRLLNSPLTGEYVQIGNRAYRLSPSTVGMNPIPSVESVAAAELLRAAIADRQFQAGARDSLTGTVSTPALPTTQVRVDLLPLQREVARQRIPVAEAGEYVNSHAPEGVVVEGTRINGVPVISLRGETPRTLLFADLLREQVNSKGNPRNAVLNLNSRTTGYSSEVAAQSENMLEIPSTLYGQGSEVRAQARGALTDGGFFRHGVSLIIDELEQNGISPKSLPRFREALNREGVEWNYNANNGAAFYHGQNNLGLTRGLLSNILEALNGDLNELGYEPVELITPSYNYGNRTRRLITPRQQEGVTVNETPEPLPPPPASITIDPTILLPTSVATDALVALTAPTSLLSVNIQKGPMGRTRTPREVELFGRFTDEEIEQMIQNGDIHGLNYVDTGAHGHFIGFGSSPRSVLRLALFPKLNTWFGKSESLDINRSNPTGQSGMVIYTHSGDLSSSSYPLAQLLATRLGEKVALLPGAKNLVTGNNYGAPNLFEKFLVLSPEVAEYMTHREMRPLLVYSHRLDKDGNWVYDSEGKPIIDSDMIDMPTFNFGHDPSFLDKYDFLRVDPDDTFGGFGDNVTGRIDPKATPGTIIMVNKATGNVEGRLPALPAETVLEKYYRRPLKIFADKFGLTVGEGGDLPLPILDSGGYNLWTFGKSVKVPSLKAVVYKKGGKLTINGLAV